MDPLKGYVTVYSTGSTSETYASKMSKLLTEFNELTDNQKVNSFIMRGNIIYSLSHKEGIYSRLSCGTAAGTVEEMNLRDGRYAECIMRSTGNTINNNTSTATTDNLSLCYYL